MALGQNVRIKLQDSWAQSSIYPDITLAHFLCGYCTFISFGGCLWMCEYIEVEFCRNYGVCMSVGIAAGNLCHASREFHMLSWLMFAKQNLTAYTLLTPSYSETNTLTHTGRAQCSPSHLSIQLISYSICMFKHLLRITHRFISLNIETALQTNLTITELTHTKKRAEKSTTTSVDVPRHFLLV